VTVILGRWLVDDEEPRPRELQDGVPHLLISATVLASEVKRVVDADREVLPPDLVAAGDELRPLLQGPGRCTSYSVC
jgi:hypothetical protein